MASLQIRQFPDEVYQALSYRAERAGRSLAQQAVAELRSMSELVSRERRSRAVGRLRERLRNHGPVAVSISPEALIREDRER